MLVVDEVLNTRLFGNRKGDFFSCKVRVASIHVLGYRTFPYSFLGSAAGLQESTRQHNDAKYAASHSFGRHTGTAVK